MDPLSPGVVKNLLNRYNFRIKKSFGQNFLVDDNIIKKILNTASLNAGDIVIEIGPGLGSLTRRLSMKARLVIAVEIDRNLFPLLGETLAGLDNVRLLEADALKTDFDRLVADETGSLSENYKVVANLPYYITSPLIMHLLENKFHISKAVIMIQEEVADRLIARHGTREYGALTVAVNYYSAVEKSFRVPRTVFIPRPEVDSAVVCLTPRRLPPVTVNNSEHFFKLVRAAFQQRRKTLLNALSGADKQLSKVQWQAILNQAGIDPARRGETLSLEEFVCLANLYT